MNPSGPDRNQCCRRLGFQNGHPCKRPIDYFSPDLTIIQENLKRKYVRGMESAPLNVEDPIFAQNADIFIVKPATGVIRVPLNTSSDIYAAGLVSSGSASNIGTFVRGDLDDNDTYHVDADFQGLFITNPNSILPINGGKMSVWMVGHDASGSGSLNTILDIAGNLVFRWDSGSGELHLFPDLAAFPNDYVAATLSLSDWQNTANWKDYSITWDYANQDWTISIDGVSVGSRVGANKIPFPLWTVFTSLAIFTDLANRNNVYHNCEFLSFGEIPGAASSGSGSGSVENLDDAYNNSPSSAKNIEVDDGPVNFDGFGHGVDGGIKVIGDTDTDLIVADNMTNRVGIGQDDLTFKLHVKAKDAEESDLIYYPYAAPVIDDCSITFLTPDSVIPYYVAIIIHSSAVPDTVDVYQNTIPSTDYAYIQAHWTPLGNYPMNPPAGIAITGAGDGSAMFTINFGVNTGHGLHDMWIFHFASHAGVLICQNNADDDLFHVLSDGTVRFNDAFDFPTADGTPGQAMVTDGSGTVDFATISGGTDEKAKVSANDTTAGYLNGKLVAGSRITLTENNNGSNETLGISADAETDPVYDAWLSNPPDLSEFNNDVGFVDVEGAQDAIGAMIVNTDTIDLTYTDATPEFKADVKKQMSITSDASGIKLVGDATSPGASMAYDTDIDGLKGWHAKVPDYSSGRLISRSILTSASANYTTPAGCTKILVQIVGGGGGGGGATGTVGKTSVGGGGGSGGYAEKQFTVTANTAYAYTCGAGGAGGLAANGTGSTGLASTFIVGATTVTANGGLGGVGGTAAAGFTCVLGGAGAGVSTNGDLNCTGAPGSFSIVGGAAVGVSGFGGPSHFGGGGNSIIAAAVGNVGGVYGGGGGGAMSVSAVGNAGGTGGAGCIIVWAFTA